MSMSTFTRNKVDIGRDGVENSARKCYEHPPLILVGTPVWTEDLLGLYCLADQFI